MNLSCSVIQEEQQNTPQVSQSQAAPGVRDTDVMIK